MLDEGLVQAYVFYLKLGGIGVAYNNYMNPYGYSNMYSNPQMPVNNLQMPMPNAVQQPVIKGRYASSLDEVRAAQIDFDGSKTYFVCPAINTIYAKSIDMNGNSLIEAYVLDRGDTKNNPLEDKLNDLDSRIKVLEELITAPPQAVNPK